MAKLAAVNWVELVRGLTKAGFNGPFQGGKHPYMIKGALVLTLPNPHRKKISVDLLVRILKQAHVSREQWLEK